MDNGCALINSMVLFDQRLEKVLNNHPYSLMRDFKPTHFLNGSSAEATRLGYPSEIDVTNKLEGLSVDLFQVSGCGLKVTDKGKAFFGSFIELVSMLGHFYFIQ